MEKEFEIQKLTNGRGDKHLMENHNINKSPCGCNNPHIHRSDFFTICTNCGVSW